MLGFYIIITSELVFCVKTSGGKREIVLSLRIEG
jgi:hypothetical protein